MFGEARGLTLPSLILPTRARKNYIMMRKWCHHRFWVSDIKRNPSAPQMQRVWADSPSTAAVSKLSTILKPIFRENGQHLSKRIISPARHSTQKHVKLGGSLSLSEPSLSALLLYPFQELTPSIISLLKV